MKKMIGLIVSLVVLIICFSVNVFALNDTEIFVNVGPSNGEAAAITATDRVFYLPSSANIQKLSLMFEGNLSYRAVNAAFSGTLSSGETLDLTPAKTTDERGAICYKFELSYNGKTETYTFYHDENLPSVFVSTSKGLSYIESSKENRDKESQILVLASDGSVAYSDIAEGTFSEIKGRGNATWSYYKKPYQIKLASKTELLGMEKAKTWILLAGYTDQSALHNALAFTLGDALEIPYNIEYRFVSLYIDGSYRGLYMICEKVQVDESRVDIVDLEKANEASNPDKELDSFPIKTVVNDALISGSILEYYTYCEGMRSPEDITGGYLVELDNIRGTSEPCHFQTENGNIYVVKSPEYASREEMAYIAELFADMEEAIFSSTGYNQKGIHYSEYIDMESFAGIYTLQELLKNWDAYLSSMFFFKDADDGNTRAKIYMGPLWDMDNTLGNINFNLEYGTDTAYLWAQNGVFNSYKREFAKKLMAHDDFRAIVAQKFDKAYHEVQCYLEKGGGLESDAGMIAQAVTMDRTRWKLYDADSWLLGASGYKSSVKFVQFEEYGTALDERKDTALGFFRYYLSERADALLMLIGDGTYAPPSETESETTAVITESTLPPTESQTTEIEETTLYQDSSASDSDAPAPVLQEKSHILLYILTSASVTVILLVSILTLMRKKKK